MKNRMLLVMLLILLTASVALGQNDLNERDTLFVGSAEVDAGQQAVIEVTFFNDEVLGAVTIPMIWDSPDITLDSVSFAGGRLNYISTKIVTPYPEDQTVVFGVIVFSEALIQPGTGLAATMYFDIPPGTPDQYITLDTTTRGPASLFFTNESSFNFAPVYIGGTIKVGDPVLQPHINLSPPAMTFEGTVGYPSPVSQQLQISNTGGGTMDWSATTSSSWLSVSPASGTGFSFVAVNVNIFGLSEGVYYDTVYVNCPDADNSPQKLPVTLTIIKLPPHIVVAPTSFTVSAIQGGVNPDDRYLSIATDVLGSDLNWTATNSQGWMTLAPTSGAPPDSLQLSFDISGLSFGYYYDTVVVSDPNATNSPKRIPVTLQIVSDLPVMEIEPMLLNIVGKTGINPAPRSVYIYNSGEGSMSFSVTESSDRITSVVPLNDVAPSNIFFSFETSTLPIGDYYDTVVISSPEAINSPQEVVIHYHIASNPADLYVIPTTININYYECWQGINSTPPLKYFQIQNNGGGTLIWTASNHADWLKLQYTSGSSPIVNSVTLTGAADDLPLGVYKDTITIVAAGALNSPKKIIVTLNIIESTATPVLVFNESIHNIPAQEVFGVLLGELAAVGEVLNQNPGCMDYWVEEDIPWLTILDSVGEAPHILRAVLDVGSFTYGTYPDSFLVYSSTAPNSPVVVHLNMLVWRLHGDYNWDNFIDIGDVVRAMAYIFRGGPAARPEPLVGDTNCDYFIDVGDIVVVLNYIFRFGNAPCGNL